ncbi:enoyl-CoA hydratase [Bradyrhizobium macuxiense]|uniref:Enoyl-CoA hydratase n=1 Tax=Bradyrhizobium macuxiense TaxID=1755647 RepID=A0A109JGD4_9BRAD|nr:crotonase/enoyl-CoA hydratase family protein [Bradyrhizobium macuxiense]KWV48488.1 enoyl-CoA hydratase [Bradyrhizobium macuxiense]
MDKAENGRLPGLDCLAVELQDSIAIVRLARPEKRNALNDEAVFSLQRWFSSPPSRVKAVVLAGQGNHFCAGLDLSELTERSVAEGVMHSRSWHRAFESIEFGSLPVVAVLHGAVIGGGLELAAAAHIRIAEASAFYALPEGIRGIYVGGGASVRVPKLIGVARMMDMMLTGRTYDAEQGGAIGLSQYVVPRGEGLARAIELAHKMAGNAPLTNFALIQALPRIAESGPEAGYLLEALMAGVAQGDAGAKERLHAFLEGKASKVQHNA